MNKLVLYLEKEKFLRQLLENIFKKNSHPIHTEESLVDRFYLIEDLRPSIIFFDVQSLGKDLDQLLNLVVTHQEIQLIATGSFSDKELLIGKVNRFIVKPFQVNSLYSELTGPN